MKPSQRLESFFKSWSGSSTLGLEPRSPVGLLDIEAEVVPDSHGAEILAQRNFLDDWLAQLLLRVHSTIPQCVPSYPLNSSTRHNDSFRTE